jgi:hypothetical protein
VVSVRDAQRTKDRLPTCDITAHDKVGKIKGQATKHLILTKRFTLTAILPLKTVCDTPYTTLQESLFLYDHVTISGLPWSRWFFHKQQE